METREREREVEKEGKEGWKLQGEEEKLVVGTEDRVVLEEGS